MASKKTHGRTASSKPIADELVQELADKAEAGYDVDDGVGPLTAVAFLAELGDARRFTSSRKAVRYAGLDITVPQSDSKRAAGKLSRQGPATLRWAAFEAAPVRPQAKLARPRLQSSTCPWLLRKVQLGIFARRGILDDDF